VSWSAIPVFILSWWTVVSINRHLLRAADNNVGSVSLYGVSLLAALGLFASLLAHELVRVLATRRLFNVSAKKLHLFVLGGVSDVEERTSPRIQALAALLAPAFSIAVGLVLLVGIAIASAPLPRAADDLDRLGPPGILILELAAANFLVALIHLLPAYPLDGGRLLRAAIWRATGNVERATRIATWTGQVAGFTLVTLGVGSALAATTAHGYMLFSLAASVWLAFIGWFVASAAAEGYAVERRSA